MQPREDLDACLTAQAPPQEDGARNRGDVLRIRIALTLGTFLLAGCAIAGTALADTSSSPTTSAPGTAAPARPTTTAPRPGPGAAAAPPPAWRKPIRAGPTGALHLPGITDVNGPRDDRRFPSTGSGSPWDGEFA